MRFTFLLLPTCLVGLLASPTPSVAQVIRIEAESGSLNGFSLLDASFFSGGAATDGKVNNPTATYTFSGEDGMYDVSVRFCDEDDGNSSYELGGVTAGTLASWNGDQPTGKTICSPTSLLTREVATAVALHQGEIVTFDCQRDPGEPCRVDYFDFAYVPPADPAPNCIGEPADHPEVDYPEQRVFLESQGWWGARVNGDVPQFGDAEHLHIGACFPLQQAVSGTVRMDFKVVAHNAPAGSFIDRTRFHDGGDQVLYAPIIYWNRVVGPDEINVIEWEENVQIDTTMLQDGLREARPLTFLVRPDDAEIHASGGWCWDIQNVPGTGDDADPRQFCTNKVTQGRGWYDCFEYKNADVRGWAYPYEGIPSGQSYTVDVASRDGAGGTGDVTGHFARLDPNFHSHDQGVILFDHIGEHVNEPLTIGGDVLTPGVHVLFLMTVENDTCSDQDGEISGGIRVPILVNSN